MDSTHRRIGRRGYHLMSLSLVLALGACGGAQDAAETDTPADDPAAMSASFAAEAVPLQERDVESFLTVMREFKRLGLEYDDKVGDDPGASVSNMATAWSANREAMDILRRNDFDVPRFQRVTYSIMMAMAASEMAGNESKMKEGEAQLEAMKGKLPPEMFEQMKKAQEQAVQMTQSMMNQPAGNVELVNRYRAELEGLNR